MQGRGGPAVGTCTRRRGRVCTEHCACKTCLPRVLCSAREFAGLSSEISMRSRERARTTASEASRGRIEALARVRRGLTYTRYWACKVCQVSGAVEVQEAKRPRGFSLRNPRRLGGLRTGADMFSGASTPQRTTRRSARSSRAPSAFGLGTPAPSGSPAPSTLHGRTLGADLVPAQHSRAALSASPVPPSRARSAAARSAVAVSEVGSAMMDVDEQRGGGGHREQRDDKVLVRDEHYSITERKNLPQDVRRVVEASGQFPSEIRQHFESCSRRMHACTRSLHATSQRYARSDHGLWTPRQQRVVLRLERRQRESGPSSPKYRLFR